jgi:chitinase
MPAGQDEHRTTDAGPAADPLTALEAMLNEDTSPALPEPPRRELSIPRVLFGLFGLLLICAGAALALRRATASAQAVAAPWFAPYVDTTLTPTYPFEDASANPARNVVLGFVVSSPKSPCTPSWGAYDTLGQAASALDLDRRIAQVHGDGGEAIASFGGEANSELAVGCKNQRALVAAYRAVLERYKLKTIDLDIEGAALANSQANLRRARAIASLEQTSTAARRKLSVWLTLPVTPQGLTPEALSVLATMLAAHVRLAGVNVMAMDFNSSSEIDHDMLGAVESALNTTHAQLTATYRQAGILYGSQQAWNRLGVTVMIGQNDVPGEDFDLADARALTGFVQHHHLARTSIWSLNRDSSCGAVLQDTTAASNTCSGIAQGPLQFTRAFALLAGSLSNANAAAASTTGESIPQLTEADVDNPAESPYPIWSAAASYRTGYKVVWHHEVYEAKWFSQGQVPDAPVSSQWDTAWELIGPVLPGEHAPKLRKLPAGAYPSWSAGATYSRGARVLFEGLPYKAKWFTRDEPPSEGGTSVGESAEAGQTPWQPLFTIPGEPSPG